MADVVDITNLFPPRALPRRQPDIEALSIEELRTRHDAVLARVAEDAAPAVAALRAMRADAMRQAPDGGAWEQTLAEALRVAVTALRHSVPVSVDPTDTVRLAAVQRVLDDYRGAVERRRMDGGR